jgi:urea transport system substrate-binding protein
MKRRQFAKYSLLAASAPSLPVSTLLSSGSAHAALPRKIGLLIPQSGPDALYGPSGRNCAELAVEQINARGGIAGRPIALVVGDAGGGDPPRVVKTAKKLLTEDKVEAFVGLHNSATRVALVEAFAGKVTYVYTTTYEGGECARGTYVLGESPSQQLRPVIPWLSRTQRLNRWYLIGNDYVWPRGTNAKAKQYIQAYGGTVVGEQYVPFDWGNFEAVVAAISAANADAVLITLVGPSSVRFNQVFSGQGLAKSVVRLSTFLDEITLAAVGAAHSANLYSAAGYFASIKTTAAKEFAASYSTRFGADAALLNVTGQACYEGLRLLEVMGNKAGSLEVDKLEEIAQWQYTDGPRGFTVMHDRHAVRDIYLAKAEGTAFQVVKTFEAVNPGEDCHRVKR